MNNKIILTIAIVLIIAGIAHYETTKTDTIIDETMEIPASPVPVEIIAAYNQGRTEGETAMKNAIIAEVLKNDEVALGYKLTTEEGVKNRTLILIEK